MASTKMEAQTKAQTIAGEYYLRGVMETASGFKLNEDSTFEFFFSYGALDRTGAGNWRTEGDKVIFNSRPGSKGFLLSNSSTTETDGIVIKINEPNPSLRANVYAVLHSGGKHTEGFSDKNGMISFPKQPVDSINLALEFCPEKMFSFSNDHASHNFFEFRFEKDMMEVFFDSLVLHVKGEELEGRHPLLKEGVYHFEKSSR